VTTIPEPWVLDPYASAVVDVLTGDFPDLRDPVIAAIVRKHVYRYTRARGRLEVILDSPFLANWRLVNRDGRVQVACCRQSPAAADHERAERLNSALDALLGTGEGA
jgi:hypothetical protein